MTQNNLGLALLRLGEREASGFTPFMRAVFSDNHLGRLPRDVAVAHPSLDSFDALLGARA